MAHLNAVLPILRTINAAGFPGITQESRLIVQQLLEDNRKHHIFFNSAKFHNHVVHHLLDSYALGCSPQRLRAIYNEHLPTQRPAPPKKVQITQSNWKDYLEKESCWTDYVDFFSGEVKQLGIDEAVNKYFFNPVLFGRFFAELSVLIFGMEFQEPLVVAEGLSLAALHSNMEFLQQIPPTSSTTTTLREIFAQVQSDKRLEGHSSRKAVLHEYMSKWDVEESDVAAKEKELFEMVVLLYAGPVRPLKRPRFDFSLMHSLTGSVFVHELLQHFPNEKGAQVLKALLGVTLMYYISAGRPKLYIDNLKAYKTKLPDSPNPWLEIIKFAIETNDVHATKVSYSLLQGQAWFGEFDGKIFLKAAQMTADAIRAHPNEGIYQGGVWDQYGIGFDHGWEDAKY